MSIIKIEFIKMIIVMYNEYKYKIKTSVISNEKTRSIKGEEKDNHNEYIITL